MELFQVLQLISYLGTWDAIQEILTKVNLLCHGGLGWSKTKHYSCDWETCVPANESRQTILLNACATGERILASLIVYRSIVPQCTRVHDIA